MADLAVDDEDGGQLDKAEVVAGLLLGPRQGRRKRLNQLWPTSTTHRRGGWRSGSPGGGRGRAALAFGGTCGV